MKLISFIIPTYNFSEFISETLDSILSEDSRYYEIIVFDGCSTDRTPEIMHAYQNNHDCIKYVRSPERQNIDIDLNNAIEEASGEYIWTLSSDDVLAKGWLGTILNEITRNSMDIYLVPAVHCSRDMTPQVDYPIKKDRNTDTAYYSLTSLVNLEHYLSTVRTSEGLFSFCSSCVIRRVRIMDTDSLVDANGTCWRYATRMIQVITKFPVAIGILGVFILHKRGENDSFSSEGRVRRLEIAIIKWAKAISTLSLPSNIHNKMLEVVHSDIGFFSMLHTGQFAMSFEEKVIYESCVKLRFKGDSTKSQIIRAVLLNTPQMGVLKYFLDWGKSCIQSLRTVFYQRS